MINNFYTKLKYRIFIERIIFYIKMKKATIFNTISNIYFSQIDIVGGDDANISDYPWQVALTEQSANWISAFIGGSIIDNYWILTAAHCVEDGFNGTPI